MMRKTELAAGIMVMLFVMLTPVMNGPAAAQYATNPDTAQVADTYGPVVSTGALASMFNKDILYDIYYEVSTYEVNRVDNVRILDTVSLAGVTFLRVRYPSVADRDAFIVLASVRAIIPTAASKPIRSYNTGKQN